MKKILLLSGLFLAIAGGSLSARDLTGIGIYGNFLAGTSDNSGGLGLTLKYGHFPVLGAEFNFTSQTGNIGLSCDYWVINSSLTGVLWYYLGVGLYGGMGISPNHFTGDFGLRIPIGLQIWPVEKLEIFGELAPRIAFIQENSVGINWGGFSLRVGLRVHF
jgi:opacity protein-like surface antigen